MDEKTIKAANIPTMEELCERINTKPLQEAIDAFIAVWNEAIAKLAEDFDVLYQAILDMCPYLADVCRESVDVWRKCLEIIQEKRPKAHKWRRYNAIMPRPLLLDKRGKIHRCRNAC